MFFDEIHIKPFIRYRGDHIIRNYVDQPETEAKTFLALMVCCLMGGSTFVARLIPVHSLEHEFLSEQLKQLLHIVYDCGGFVDFLSDNCRCIFVVYQSDPKFISFFLKILRFTDPQIQ